MNRREFTASLAALVATPALPFSPASAAGAAPVAVPSGAYAWGQLIARAQNGCSPAVLARHLRLSTAAADQLFSDMVADGVLRAPSAAGIARAVNPIEIPTAVRTVPSRLADHARDLLRKSKTDNTQTLVKAEHPRLGCDITASEDETYASTDQSVQESPERG